MARGDWVSIAIWIVVGGMFLAVAWLLLIELGMGWIAP